ncbi:EscU/YscU/HrcU family type III secretion system export apparatus switch protein [Anaerocolumna sp. AGMB13020]|uniref:EscU/YscU/HrcU family type III secretion system export apparatus switch protein n=1 Tax=Anaerocolumna sp. AGMB13020 TaxID=3081750 RepID=UPI00295355F4|nr:EscU/YscU/HrcU family type III secretion system export apparatus switch protein [Anaerocolumna sp. AGMB13020]WOO36933.1 EscU/YscU/HrcU family type III secretion system export apparatus switch protein [Anaerocolumna sp. AGMB13020]
MDAKKPDRLIKSDSGNQQDAKENKDSDFMNKTAIALGYNEEDAAPRIIATGKGFLADKILKGAKQNQIPVHEDSRLAASLSKLDLGDYIPPELYEVVSEIMIFVDDMDRIKSKVRK